MLGPSAFEFVPQTTKSAYTHALSFPSSSYVSNLTERPVVTIDDVVVTLADGEKNRSVASTKMNSVSSRSHLLLQVNQCTVQSPRGSPPSSCFR